MNARQQRFVAEYLVDLNATQAAIRAGYSPKTARAIAQQNLTKIDIQTAISAAMAERGERTQLTQDAVLNELRILNFADVTHYAIDDTGNVALTDDAPPQAMRAIASLRKKVIHTDAGIVYDTEIKFWNKPAALKMSGDHLGMFDGSGKGSGDAQAKQQEQRAVAERLKEHVASLREKRKRLESTMTDESLTH